MNQTDLASYTIWTATDAELISIAASIARDSSSAEITLFKQASSRNRDTEITLRRAVAVIREFYS